MKFSAITEIPPTRKSLPTCVIDLGFSKSDDSIGMATHRFLPKCDGRSYTFKDTIFHLNRALTELDSDDCVLILEAPLSIALTEDGSPCHRNFELQGNFSPGLGPRSPKGWYYQAGANLSLGASVLLRHLVGRKGVTVHLAEAFYCSYKQHETHPDHTAVASELLGTWLNELCDLIEPKPEIAGGKIEPLPGLEGRIDGIPWVLLRKELKLKTT